MTAEVVTFRPRDHVRQDSGPIVLMYRNMGTAAAEQVVTRALTELALAMTGLAAQVRGGELADMDRQLRRLHRMADQLGMISLAQVAQDVRACLDRADRIAFAAVWARLLRVAERSLASDRGLADQSV